MSYETVIWKVDEGVGHITLNRPESLNAWNEQFGQELKQVITGEAQDESVRALLITGAGRGFSSGADLKAQGAGETLQVVYHPILLGIRNMPKPVLAAVNGPAVGIGCSLALACDLILCSESAYFGLAFVNIGLMPDGGSTAFVPARVGATRAFELALLGERVSPHQALDWGLVNRVVKPESLPKESLDLARKLAKGPTRSYAGSKRALNNMLYPRLEEQLDLEAEIQHELVRSDDFVEGVGAFVEKREASFKGS
jgi:2-(1,2-epoxy-1,2-dihydrophenyl)acetyl-CoA isomerase